MMYINCIKDVTYIDIETFKVFIDQELLVVIF